MASTQKNKTVRSKSSTKTRKRVSDKEKLNTEVSKRDNSIRNELLLLFSGTLTLVLLLFNFHLGSYFGDAVSKVMFGLFGIIAYIVPLYIFIGTGFLLSNKDNPKAIMKFSSVVIFNILLCALLQLIMVKYSSDTAISAFYKTSAEDRTGGGIIGGLVSKGLCLLLGEVITYIVIVVFIIMTIVIITEKSFIKSVKTGGSKMYISAREDMARFKENSALRASERRYRKQQRLHNKYKGVAINNTKLSDPKHEEDDIHEITGDFTQNKIYRGPVNIDQYELNEVKKGYAVEKDENEPFIPKEKIDVSSYAKSQMARKPFSNAASNHPTFDKGHIEESSEEPNTVKRQSVRKEVKTDYIYPPLSLLIKGASGKKNGRDAELKETAEKLQNTLFNFGVNVTITDVNRGPSVTRYELQPEMGTKVSKITSLSDDIKLNLAAADIRIEAPIPGKAAVGIEVPNSTRESVYLRELIESDELRKNPSKLAFAAGKDIGGHVIVADIAKMPHMLIAGTTGSGKSVFTNSIIMSILFRASPSDVRLIIVDPKVVEFGVYNGIPHLLIPVVTDPKKAAGALAWAVTEMSNRYKKFADLNVRDLKGYNDAIVNAQVDEGEEKPEKLPQILIIIDELADLMMVAAKEVEESICRLAQLARAAGIHLVIATQRPSVDVVTGLIKANIPSRVALLVSSGTDSRTIIDMNGAEKLLGNGDMLFYPSGYVKPIRVQGAFVSDGEVQKIVSFLTENAKEVVYNESIEEQIETTSLDSISKSEGMNERDDYFADAGRFSIEKEKASASMLQRFYKIGFNRAGRIINQLEEAGVIGSDEGTKPRKILMTLEEFEQYLQN